VGKLPIASIEYNKKLDLGDCDRPEDLNQCMLLCHDLEQYNPEAVRLLTKKKLENSPESKTQAIRKSNKSKSLINKEFERLGEIKEEQEKPEKDLEFREQEIGIAVKRRAIAIHHAKVPKSHLDNKNDKPGNDNALEKKNSQTDWLRNKQIIVYNRAEIDDYLSNVFEQILYQVEEREEKFNI
ncbi:34257_t:CDS:2, partial [Racocetra persica]